MNARWNPALTATLVAALVAFESPAQDALKPAEATRGRVCRMTQLVGVPVTGAEGEKLGDLKELVIDDDHDCVAYGIVAIGGEKMLAIPFATLQRTGTDSAIAFVVATSGIAKAPSFDARSWPAFDRAYATKIYDFYKAKPYWKDAPAHDAKVDSDDPPVDPAKDAPTAHAKEREDRCNTCRTTKAIGQQVQDLHDKKIGEIQDIVVDEASGRVAYAVLSTSGLLGIGERLIALPWTALQPAPADGKPRVLDATQQKIEMAPSFDKKSWPDMADRRWGADVHRYWDQQPYWDAHAGASDVARHE